MFIQASVFSLQLTRGSSSPQQLQVSSSWAAAALHAMPHTGPPKHPNSGWTEAYMQERLALQIQTRWTGFPPHTDATWALDVL